MRQQPDGFYYEAEPNWWVYGNVIILGEDFPEELREDG